MYGRFAEVYDRLMRHMPYAAWLRFLRECWERYGKPETVVDLGCGTGLLSLPLAGQGFQVTGIDLSEQMLAAARRKEARGREAGSFGGTGSASAASVRWSRQDMREWRLPEPADCVFSFCDCLNYLLEEDDIRRTFASTYAGLKDGGLFIFDVHSPSYVLSLAENQPFVLDEDDIAYLWTSEYDPDRMQIDHELTFFVAEDRSGSAARERIESESEDDRRFVRFRERHSQRAYSPQWLSDELRRAGFHVLDRCADFGWVLPDEDSERIFFVARKAR